jgi:diguanylate cyclase (GGDEF)-like protein
MRRLPRLSRLASARVLALALVVALLGCGVETLAHPLATVDSSLQDFALARRTPRSYLGATTNTAADPRKFITIVAIDERTLSELGAYNGGYPRAIQAQVVENLLAAPPRVIAFDVGFFESTADDDALALALDHARSAPIPTTVILSAAGLNRVAEPADAANTEPAFDSLLAPVPVLAERSTMALANVLPDARGTVRTTPLVASVGGVERPSLGLAAVAAYLRRPTFEDGRSSGLLDLAGRQIPLEADGTMRLNFFGPPSRPNSADSSFRVVSFVDVLRGRVDPSTWRGGLVFVGTLGAMGLADDYWTPTSDSGRKMAGVEIHANAAATLFSSSYLQTVPWPAQMALFVGIALLMVLIASHASAIGALTIGPLTLAVTGVGQFVALYVFGELMPIAAPLIVGLALLVIIAGPRLVHEQRLGRAAHAELARVRNRDRLTGLANRRTLLSQIWALLDSHFALLVLDINRLKDVNDTLGHAAGDQLLRSIAERLTDTLAGSDAFVARLDGDEFAVLLPEASAAQAATACTALLKALDNPVDLNGQSIGVSASIGIAEFPHHGSDPETLLRHADAAMHAAKQTRQGHAVYMPGQESQTAERLEMVNALRHAIADGQLRLRYQPKIECGSGEVRGMEALVRWEHPTQGMIAPVRFIPLAEETGLIGAVTRWVLETAVAQARAWNAAGLQLKIAVNLSAWDLQDPSLSVFIRELLEAHRVSPEMLSLEITETALLADPRRALQLLNELTAYGVDASLDDFGTGYSSLTYVRQLPLRELKIDALFVRGLVTAERDRAIICSTIELGHRLGMRVVAEGVEDGTTLSLLTELGCDQVQGYYISKPMPAVSVADWVRTWQSLESPRDDLAA